MKNIVAILCVLAVSAAALAVTAEALSTRAELKERFKQRDPALVELKKAGKVGETSKGYVEAVKEEHARDAQVKKIMDPENADRKELYGIIAREHGTPVESVAAAAAKKNFEYAQKGEWLKYTDGWHQKP